MPTPERTSQSEIVQVARDLLERKGVPGITMREIAQRVGVQPPSLYKRVGGRDDLIRLVAESALRDLSDRLDSASDIRDLANRFRAFGHEYPAAFQLVMTPGAGVPRVSQESAAAASEPVLRWAARFVDKNSVLEAARTLTAWAAGFVSMELNGGFNLDGEVERAWEFGRELLIAGLGRTASEPSPMPDVPR